MAYSVDGKIYTDHPLMDEIVDNCKTIFKSIVVKNDALALQFETEEIIKNSTEFINIVEDKVPFNSFPFTEDMLKSYTYADGTRVFTDEGVEAILEDRNIVPINMRDDLLAFCKKYYIDNYEEKNNYYRSLMGLPPYIGTAFNVIRERTDRYYDIYIYESDFPSNYDTSHIEFIIEDVDPITKELRRRPIFIHELDPLDISILEQEGFIDSLIEEYRGFNYSYLRYLGYKSIDVYKARKALKWEILYMPRIEQLVQQRFEELYGINRSIYLKRTYQDAMSLGSSHYDESIILLLLCQTFNDMIVDVPEWYIRRDIFDLRSVQYFLESYGVEYYEVIPLKYQVAIVKNLNKLIKYKSSTKNNNDIIDLFDLKGTYIYKYYLYKKKINDSDSDDPKNYKLEFIKVKESEPFDKYIDNSIYRYSYDNFTLQDKYWDGVYKEWENSFDKTFKEKLHEEVRENHIEQADYTVTGTKYMSVDYEVDMSKYKYQVEYFFNYLLDSDTDTKDIKIILPTVSMNTEVEVSNIFIMLYLLSFSYDQKGDKSLDKVIRPEDRNTHTDDITTPPYEYYNQLFKDDGDYDDAYKWNEEFDDYIIPPTTDKHGHKEWEIKSYIENQDPIATAEGYNSYPIWVEKYLDWVKLKFPETLTVEYNRVNGFNNSLEPEDLDRFFDIMERRNKVYNFERGYEGYSYIPVYNIDNQLLYYEITYNFDEPIYTYDEYLVSVCYPNEPKYNPEKETYEEFIEKHTAWEYTLTQEAYEEWIDTYIANYMHMNPRGPLGIGGFRVVKKVDTVADIVDNFDVNTACYDDIVSKITNANCREENILLRYVFKTFCTKEFDYNFYKVNGEEVNQLQDVLKNRDYILYNFYINIISENNEETRKNNIRAAMNDIITTLEYYLSDDNLEYIYSSFSISSFSSLIYYMYLMVCYFKSWKVHFLDPVVTINTDDILENGNNYGQGIDSIAETKINYWHEDKEFKRESVAIKTGFNPAEMDSKNIKEVLDIYGRFDPDPEEDYDYDGFTPENDQDEDRHNIIRNKDINGGVSDASMNIPYHMINGGKTYGKYLDMWDLDGSTPVEMQDYLSVNGGGVYHEDEYLPYNSYERLFNFVINGGSAGTNEFYTRTLHTKVINREISQDVLMSDREANVIQQTDDGLYISQNWAAWVDFLEVKTVSDEAYNYINYIMEVLYDDLIIITDDELLTERINEVMNQELASMIKVSNFANDPYRMNEYKNYVGNRARSIEQFIDDFSPYNWINF